MSLGRQALDRRSQEWLITRAPRPLGWRSAAASRRPAPAAGRATRPSRPRSRGLLSPPAAMEIVDLFAMITSILAVFVAAPWVVFTGIAKVRAARADEGAELRMSELRGLIDDAVAEATAPLAARIETLEAIVTDDEPRPLLADALDLDAPADAREPVSVRRARA